MKRGLMPVPQWVYAAAPQARRSWGLAAIFGLVAVFLLVSTLTAVVVFSAAGPALSLDQYGVDDRLLVEIDSAYMVIAGGLLIMASLTWAHSVERRPRATLGLGNGRVAGPLVAGLAGGGALYAGITVLGFGLTWLVDPSLTETWWGFADQGAALAGMTGEDVWMLVYFSVAVAIYAAAEEVMFRGWLLSSLASRWGVWPAVAVSSLLFAVYHSQYLTGVSAFNLFWLAAMAVSGVFFAMVAIQQRSLYLAIGLHAGFNIVIFLSDSLARAGEAGLPVAAGIAASIDEVSYPVQTPIGGGEIADIVVFGLLAAGLAVWIVRRGVLASLAEARPDGRLVRSADRPAATPVRTAPVSPPSSSS